MTATQSTVQAITPRQMEALWIFISSHGRVTNDLAKKLLIWLTTQTEFLTKPVELFVPKSLFGVDEFSRVVQNGVHDMQSSASGAANLDLFCAAMGTEFRFFHTQQNNGSSIAVAPRVPDRIQPSWGNLPMVPIPTRNMLDQIALQDWFRRG